ncbi:MFS transporter [Pigmentiphaga aceris]|uniref:MFS transporter n=2 Tax=Pigmentiphaga aceris TaxID=1940612 RepID=A0A5C0B5T2_9BURK|nr:MFS transporter [Pigmentiphaga aceris]
MAALPVYVQAPAYYAGEFGVSLAAIGWVLFAARLVDTVQDPWLGRWVDALAQRGRLTGVLAASAVVLILAFAGLWLPPLRGPVLAAWLAAMLILACTAHSVLQISHLAWGARIGSPEQVTRAAAWREGLGLLGVVVASILPAKLATQHDAPFALHGYVAGFAVLLLLGLALLLRAAPSWRGVRSAVTPAWRAAWARPAIRRLLLPYFLNALSVAIPATLAMFYINDRIEAPASAGLFLGGYFAAGAVGLPAWTWLAQRIGAARAWRVGMVLAVLSFASAGLLGAGDTTAYAVVCLFAGLALGADLALPPVLLAERIPAGEQPAGYYGVWNLIGKLALALSGLALSGLSLLGYQPGVPASGGLALPLLYAVLPCAIKLMALWVLSRGIIAVQENAA